MPDGGRAARLARWTALLWSLLSFPASAELPPQITVEWAGSPLCPRSLGLDAEILRLLGDRRTEGEPTKFVARVDELADRSVNYYRLSLTVSSESRRADRSVELATCTDVQDAAALLIASAIDPDAITRAKPPPPPPPPPPKPKPEPEPEPVEEPAAPLLPTRWSLRAQAQLDVLSLPGFTAGPTAGALFQFGHYRAWLDAQYLAPRTAEAPGDVLRTRVDLVSGVLGGAYVWRFDDFVLGPALGAELGRLRTRSRLPDGDAPVVRPKNDATLWGGFLFGAVAAYAVDRWVGVEAGLFASVPVQHPELKINGGDKPFYTTQPIAMRLALGLRVSLGSP